MILCEWDAPKGDPGQNCVHLFARILSTSFTSISIFSVCCYSSVSISMVSIPSSVPARDSTYALCKSGVGHSNQRASYRRVRVLAFRLSGFSTPPIWFVQRFIFVCFLPKFRLFRNLFQVSIVCFRVNSFI
jgi:hypothetical protein